jgi:hypothetical protein
MEMNYRAIEEYLVAQRNKNENNIDYWAHISVPIKDKTLM